MPSGAHTLLARPRHLPVAASNAEEMTRILVASDLTEGSLPAIRVAVGLGERMNASVVALHTADLRWTGNRRGSPPEVRDVERELQEQIQLVAPSRAHQVQSVIRTGCPASAILALAREVTAHLIVLAVHGRGARLVASHAVATKVLGEAACLVLIVSPGRE